MSQLAMQGGALLMCDRSLSSECCEPEPPGDCPTEGDLIGCPSTLTLTIEGLVVRRNLPGWPIWNVECTAQINFADLGGLPVWRNQEDQCFAPGLSPDEYFITDMFIICGLPNGAPTWEAQIFLTTTETPVGLTAKYRDLPIVPPICSSMLGLYSPFSLSGIFEVIEQGTVTIS